MNPKALHRQGCPIIFLVLLITFFVLFQPYKIFAAGKLSPEDKQRLSGYINTREINKFLADPIIKPQLELLLGKNLDHLKNNIYARTSIGVHSGLIFISGNAAHKGGLEHGFIRVDPQNGDVYAVILSGGIITVYSKVNDFGHLPAGVRQFIYSTWAQIQLQFKAPPNVELKAMN